MRHSRASGKSVAYGCGGVSGGGGVTGCDGSGGGVTGGAGGGEPGVWGAGGGGA